MFEMLPKATISASVDSNDLKKRKSLEDLMNIKVETFSEMLLRIIDEVGKVNDITSKEYFARGMTGLLDAIGKHNEK